MAAHVNQPVNTNLDKDLVIGADDISTLLYGSPKFRRRVYHLAEKGNLPHFTLGGKLHVRKSTLFGCIWAQESRRMDEREKQLVRLHFQLSRTGALLRKFGAAMKAGCRTGRLEQEEVPEAVTEVIETIEQLVGVDNIGMVEPA
jgi:hypothetical protein